MLTKDQKISLVVEIVEAKAAEAIAWTPTKDPSSYRPSGYVEAYEISSLLHEAGVLSHEHAESATPSWRDQARKSMERQARRLLDAATEQGRIVRWSSVKDGPAPRLEGERRLLYGSATGFTTRWLIDRANAIFEERVAAEKAADENVAALLLRAAEAGLPAPVKQNRVAVTYDMDGLRAIVHMAEGASD